jgi:endonuclease YncB( thermonuclease family)
VALLWSTQAAHAGKDREALIVAVPVGNTLLARAGQREVLVGLIGVDITGEEEDGEKVLFPGDEPREFLERLVLGKKVILVKERGYPKLGMQNSRNAHVYLPDGTHVNAEVIRQGYGHAGSDPAHGQMEQFRTYEREARERRAGLWGTLPPVDGAAAEALDVGETIV